MAKDNFMSNACSCGGNTADEQEDLARIEAEIAASGVTAAEVFAHMLRLVEHASLGPAGAQQEPVVEIHRNESGQIIMRKPDGSSFDMSKHVGQLLYTAPAPSASPAAPQPSCDAPPLLVCSETIRDAILVGNPYAAGLAYGLASLAKSEGLAIAPPARKPSAKALTDREAPDAAWTDLLAYVLQDDLHNRLTPRVIDIAYTAFTRALERNKDDGGPCDWFNDTRPLVKEAIEKLRKDLYEDRDLQAAEQPSKEGA